jgi:hypothetical protein
LVAVDNVHKCRLQASTSNQEAIDVGLLRQLLAVLLSHAAAIQDACLLSSLIRDLLLNPLADGLVDFLCLLGGGYFAGADRPE